METILLNAKKKKSALETKYYCLPVTKCSLNKLKLSVFGASVSFCWLEDFCLSESPRCTVLKAQEKKPTACFFPMQTIARRARKTA